MTIVLNGTTGITTPTTSTTGEFVTSVTGFKNRIINGAMVIDQRNAGAAVTGIGAQIHTDRWFVFATGTPKFTAQQSTTAPTGFINSLSLTVTSGGSPAASDQNGIGQKIEGLNVSDLAWGSVNAAPVTISFWVRSSLTGSFGVSIRNSAVNRSYVASYTISSANTFEYKTVTIPGDTTGTWLTTNGIGLDVQWDLGSGSNFQQNAGTWSASNQYALTGSTKLTATTGATFYITGVQLEKGSTATSFDYRPYGTELALCQRYYEVGTAYGEGYQAINAPIGIGSKFSVTKRAVPTTTYPTFTNGINARVGGDRSIFVDSYARYCLANATGALYAYETFTASAEL